jgi:hypothetical protein
VPHCCERIFIHGYRGRSVHDIYSGGGPTLDRAQVPPYDVLVADQHYAGFAFFRSPQGARHHLSCAKIAAHAVNRYAHARPPLSAPK